MSLQALQRRLVTIMSADAVGYSRLMAEDEEGTYDQFCRCRDVICAMVASHNGRVFGQAGDSLMAEFAIPSDAIHCAATVQRDLARINGELAADRQIPFRLGLNIGDVIVEHDRLYGDDVNIAARLQEKAPPGGVVVSSALLAHVGHLVDFEFESLGDLTLKNIAHPVQGFLALLDGQRPPVPPPAAARVDVSRPVPGFEGRPALAVVPFSSLAPTREYEYLAEGVACDLVTGLGRLRWFPVISESSSFAFRGRNRAARDVGRALGARYIVSGVVRVEGERVRIAAELADAESSTVVWRDHYDRRLAALIDVADRIVERIVSELDAEVDLAEQRRAYERPLGELGTWELIRRSLWHQARLTREDAREARRLLDEALARDPGSAEVNVQLAWWHFWDAWTQRRAKPEIALIGRHAEAALAIDPRDARAYMLAGISDLLQQQPVRCRGALHEAIRRNPSLAVAHASLGSAYLLAGEPAEAIEPLETAMRLSPQDLYLFHTMGELAVAYLMLDRPEKALVWSEQSLALRPGYWYPRVVAISAHGRLGNEAAARAALADLLAHCPRFNVDHVLWLPFTSRRWNLEMIRGLEKAGYRPADRGSE
jgi:class 3 adenylate cyclase